LTVRPVPLTTSRLPVTKSGPSGVGATLTGPFRAASGSNALVAGSPLAEKSALAWAPSQ